MIDMPINRIQQDPRGDDRIQQDPRRDDRI